MKVYRVAHATARDSGFPSGPYASYDTLPRESNAILQDMRWEHSDDAHPSPSWDRRLGGIGDHERCGFDSLDALYTWFDGWCERLTLAGFLLWVYEAPPEAVRVGEHGQAVFNPSEARELSSEPLKPIAQLALFDMAAPA